MNMRKWLRKGFTLIEVLAVVAVISVVASAGYYTATSVRESARESKLESDVASLNSAVQIYEVAGGNFTDLPDGDGDDTRIEAKVLNKLKVKADAEAMSKFNGITGSVVDARLMAGESSDSGKRAYWDAGARRFLITEGNGGPNGVREFVLSDDAADASRSLGANITGSYIRADRALDASNLKEGPKWVWEHSGATVLAKNEVPIPDPVVPAPTAFPVPDASVAPTPVTTATPFVPTPEPSSSPTPNPGGGVGSALPAGAVVAFATIQDNAVFQGNLIIANPTSGQMNNITFGGNAAIKGNLYLPGYPEIYTEWVTAINDPWNDQRWHSGNEAKFANRILGREFDDDGVEVIPSSSGWSSTPRVINLPDSDGPSNYYFLFHNNAKIEGKIYRGYDAGVLPTVSAPTISKRYPSKEALFNGGSNPPPTTINPGQYSDVTIAGSSTAASVTLQPGAYGNISVKDSPNKIILGDPLNPDVVQNYVLDSLELTGGADIEIVGRVNITIKNTVTFHGGGSSNPSVIGNIQNPDWLQLNVYSTNTPSQYNSPTQVLFTAYTQFYGKVVAPKGTVTFENNSVFNGSVAAYKMELKGGSTAFTLPPVVQ